MATIRLRRGTAAAWISADPTLLAGEPGFETDTGKLKIGDGTNQWTLLAYFAGGSSGGGTVWYTGATAPSDLVGVEDDFYLNSATGNIYQKGVSTWGTALMNIIGADGNGIATITKTGTVALVDTYTITFDNASTTTFDVTNGAAGSAGVGVPIGGTAGQVLSKIDGTDHNTQWSTPSSGGGGFGEAELFQLVRNARWI